MKMKLHILLAILTISLSAVCGATESTHVRIGEIVNSTVPKNWQLHTDEGFFTLCFPKVKLLNPISLPLSYTEDEIWEEFSWETDFIVTIRVTSKLSDAEYAALFKLRSETITQRIHEWERKHGEPINGKSRRALVQKVRAAIQLPYCYSENKSIWITSTDSEVLRTRPKDARDVADKLRAELADKFMLYNADREQDGADQPATAPQSESPDN